jgi:hypothetical protein
MEINVKTYTKRTPKTQSVSDLPLWRVVVLQPPTQAGLHLTRRYRVHPSIADAVAALAGLGSAVER